MSQFPISVDLSPMLASLQQAVDEKVLPRLHQAVRAVAQQTQINWIEAVQRARLWQGERDDYALSIDMRMTGPFTAEVWSAYRHAEEIESGRPARDLKRMLDTSHKVRTTKEGKRFLIIPFRHNTPGMIAHANPMPDHIYAAAKELAPSRIVGQTRRLSGTGAMDIKTHKFLTVNQNLYQWGQKLKVDKSDKRYAGMYRFDTSAGRGRSSAYLTFRVMMEGSPGWIIKAQAGKWIAKGVAEAMQPLAEQAFNEAVRRDIA